MQKVYYELTEPNCPVVVGGESKDTYPSKKGYRNSALIIPVVVAASDTTLCATKMKEICSQITTARLTPLEYEPLKAIAHASGATGTRRPTVFSLVQDAVPRIYIENCEAE